MIPHTRESDNPLILHQLTGPTLAMNFSPSSAIALKERKTMTSLLNEQQKFDSLVCESKFSEDQTGTLLWLIHSYITKNLPKFWDERHGRERWKNGGGRGGKDAGKHTQVRFKVTTGFNTF